jgi:hypothetical protein
MEQSFDIFHFFLFVIPGFVTVWSFRYFTDSKKNADFEYFVLSVVWGLLILLAYELISTTDQVNKLISNLYAAAVAQSFAGLFIGWFGSFLSRSDWVQKIVEWLKTRRFNIFDIRRRK